MDLSRNYLFIDETLQERLRHCRILIIGVGLGSFIAESFVRLGVSNLCICDGDIVSGSNLNRQNYTKACVEQLKTERLKDRLLAINPQLNISTVNRFVDEGDMDQLIPQYDLVINTIDFDSQAYFSCHRLCQKHNKIEILPMNLGFGFGIFVFKDSYFDNTFSKDKIIQHIISGQTQSQYIKQKLTEYQLNKREYDPQLIVGAMSNSAMTCAILCLVLAGEEVKTFPEFYFADLKSI